MKYLYVLVNSTTGFYTEQTYVSMLSLRHVTPDAFISLLVDDNTANVQNNKFLDSIRSLVNEYKIISLPSDMPAIAKSRFIKTSMREYISDDFLFVDSDTIWANPVNEDDFTFDIMGVLDGHVLFSNNLAKKKNEQYFLEMNCYPKSEYYINSGIIFSKDSIFSRKFFENWHNKWKETSLSGIFVDQPALNYVINKMSSPDKFVLPGEYNAQISNSWNFFFQAKVIHYFTFWMNNPNFNSPYIFQSLNLWEKIRENGLSDSTIQHLKNPTKAFDQNISITYLKDESLKRSALYGFIEDLYARKNRGEKSNFDFLEKIIIFLSKWTH